MADNVTEKILKNQAKDSVEDTVEKMVKWTGRGRNILTGVGITIAAAGVLDYMKNRVDDMEVHKQEKLQHRQQIQRDTKSHKYQYAGTGYEPETFNNFVQDMFSERSGHHKMGNAKFY